MYLVKDPKYPSCDSKIIYNGQLEFYEIGFALPFRITDMLDPEQILWKFLKNNFNMDPVNTLFIVLLFY